MRGVGLAGCARSVVTEWTRLDDAPSDNGMTVAEREEIHAVAGTLGKRDSAMSFVKI